ncbi:MAG: suppressor of fused domain protein [Mycobacterium sp.]
MSDPLARLRDHLRAHFAGLGIDSEPDVASVTFLGVERIDVLRFGPDPRPGFDDVFHHVSVGCSRHPMTDAAAAVSDPLRGPRAEIVLSLRSGTPVTGMARSLAVVAATPAVDGVVLSPDALVDLSGPLWTGAPFTAVLLGDSDIPELSLDPPADPVTFLSAVPITQTEGAWVRLKGAQAMRQAWADDGVDVLDPIRPAARPV